MNETLQMAIMAGLFGLLGAALTYRWLKDTGRLTDYTRKKIWFRTLSGAAMATSAWVLFHFGMEALPDRWSKPLPFIFLIGLALIHYWNPPKVTDLERQSTRRMQIGILIGGILLIAVCLILFWQRWR